MKSHITLKHLADTLFLDLPPATLRGGIPGQTQCELSHVTSNKIAWPPTYSTTQSYLCCSARPMTCCQTSLCTTGDKYKDATACCCQTSLCTTDDKYKDATACCRSARDSLLNPCRVAGEINKPCSQGILSTLATSVRHLQASCHTSMSVQQQTQHR